MTSGSANPRRRIFAHPKIFTDNLIINAAKLGIFPTFKDIGQGFLKVLKFLESDAVAGRGCPRVFDHFLEILNRKGNQICRPGSDHCLEKCL